jgi:hypothetical protein
LENHLQLAWNDRDNVLALALQTVWGVAPCREAVVFCIEFFLDDDCKARLLLLQSPDATVFVELQCH